MCGRVWLNWTVLQGGFAIELGIFDMVILPIIIYIDEYMGIQCGALQLRTLIAAPVCMCAILRCVIDEDHTISLVIILAGEKLYWELVSLIN